MSHVLHLNCRAFQIFIIKIIQNYTLTFLIITKFVYVTYMIMTTEE